MKRIGFVVAVLMLLALAAPALGKSYKSAYPVPCNNLWGAIKAVLGNPENYAEVKIDEAKMTADYNPKHSAHFDVTGVILQRTNHVTLVKKDTGCEMQVISNYSGWGHEDQGDFKKRVDEAMAKPKEAKPAEAAKHAEAAK